MHKLAILNTHPIQYFAPLYRRLAQEPDLDVTVYYCSRQGAKEYFDEGFGHRFKWDVPLTDGYQAKFLANLWKTDRVAGFWSLINPHIVTELFRHHYDALLVTGHNHASYVLAMLAARVLGTSVFMRCETHLLLERSRLRQALRRPLMKVLYKGICNNCLPIGTRNREFYRSLGVDEDRLRLVPYAVNNAYFKNEVNRFRKIAGLRRELGLPETKPLILFVSKLTARKRPMDLIEAFHRIRKQGIDSALVFVGSGELEPLLMNYALKNNLDDVHFFGFQNQSELPKFYSVADVFVLPSENEPWGLVLNEVMCAGLPVVVSDEIGAVPDLVVNGRNGFLFSAGDVDQLTKHVSLLLKSADLRRQMGRESRRIIENWDYDACVEGIKKALDGTTMLRLRIIQHKVT